MWEQKGVWLIISFLFTCLVDFLSCRFSPRNMVETYPLTLPCFATNKKKARSEERVFLGAGGEYRKSIPQELNIIRFNETVYHQDEVLYIIVAKPIHARVMRYNLWLMIYAFGDDMPSLRNE